MSTDPVCDHFTIPSPYHCAVCTHDISDHGKTEHDALAIITEVLTPFTKNPADAADTVMRALEQAHKQRKPG